MIPLPRFLGACSWRPGFSPEGGVRLVVFDWDGTLSFIRAGWGEIMQAQWLEILPPLPNESREERATLIHREIWSLNGRPSIHQAARLAEWISQRGGTSLTARDYEDDYQQRLGKVIEARRAAARSGEAPPDYWTVPGARAWLHALAAEDMELHILSGTQKSFVEEEARVLGLDHFFEDRIHGPDGPDDRAFTKRRVLEEILRRSGAPPSALLAFGDGQVEIAETKSIGGTAVAVATDESSFGSGRPDPLKLDRLMASGADLCIPDYRDREALSSLWFSSKHAIA